MEKMKIFPAFFEILEVFLLIDTVFFSKIYHRILM